MSGHLLDAVLGRLFLYIGGAVAVAPSFWETVTGNVTSLPSRAARAFALIGFVIVVLGSAITLLSIHRAVTAEPFAEAVNGDTEPLYLSGDALRNTLFHTRAGGAWRIQLAVVGLFALSAATNRSKRRLAKVGGGLALVLLALSLSLLSHAGEEGVTWNVPVQVMHSLSLLLWLPGVMVISLSRDGDTYELSLDDVRRFSRYAPIPVSVLIVTGLIRAWAVGLLSSAEISPYLVVFAGKVVAFGCALATAQRLRRAVRNDTPISTPFFERLISVEIFLLLSVLCLSTVLTQLEYPLAE